MTIPSPGIVDKILAFVDRPWKIAAVVILGLAGIIGMALYENRAEIAEAVLQGWVTPRLHPDRFPKVAQKLLADTGADFVGLAQVSVRANLLKNIAGLLKGQPDWQIAVNARPVFGTTRDPDRLVAFFEGRAVCHDLDAVAGEEERVELALSLWRRCFVAVPPVRDGPLLGILAIAWRQPPLASEVEEGATKLLYTAATELATW